MAIDNEQVALAALTIEGNRHDGESQADWQQRISDTAVALVSAIDPNGPLVRRIAAVRETKKKFTGVFVGAKLEEKSTRYLIKLLTEDRRTGQPKEEFVRTERTDAGPEAQNLVQRMREHRGERFVLFVEMQPLAGQEGREVRILRHAEHIGPALAREAA